MDSAQQELLNETLEDVTIYLSGGQEQLAVQMIMEDAPAFALSNKTLIGRTLNLMDSAFTALIGKGDETGAQDVVEKIFEFVSLADKRFLALDPLFLRRYQKALIRTKSSANPVHRVFRHGRLLDLFSLTRELPGDVVECGCLKGLSSLQLCDALREWQPGWAGEGFHIFDSFKGLSEPGPQDLNMAGLDAKHADRLRRMTKAGNLVCPYEVVSRTIWAEFPRVELHKGWIPASFSGEPQRRCRFVHVDVDLYEPTLSCFEFFYPQLVEGGVIVTDDYTWPGGRQAVEEFCSTHQLSLQLTDAKQAYLIKG